jgi:hypothetical protein
MYVYVARIRIRIILGSRVWIRIEGKSRELGKISMKPWKPTSCSHGGSIRGRGGSQWSPEGLYASFANFYHPLMRRRIRYHHQSERSYLNPHRSQSRIRIRIKVKGRPNQQQSQTSDPDPTKPDPQQWKPHYHNNIFETATKLARNITILSYQ